LTVKQALATPASEWVHLVPHSESLFWPNKKCLRQDCLPRKAYDGFHNIRKVIVAEQQQRQLRQDAHQCSKCRCFFLRKIDSGGDSLSSSCCATLWNSIGYSGSCCCQHCSENPTLYPTVHWVPRNGPMECFATLGDSKHH
jgi:hypothetical protein